MFKRGLLQISGALGVMMASVTPALAAVNIADAPKGVTGFDTLPETITTLFNFVIILASVIFVVLFLVGGIQYLTAAGNEEATGKAKRLLVDAIIGLVIVLAAWAIGNFILNQLGVSVNTSSGGGIGGGSGSSIKTD